METVAMPHGMIELLDRNGRVEQRIALNASAVRVGRAYDNDLIVDDVYASPHHVSISANAEGRWHVHDLGSINGIRIGGSGTRLNELTLDGEQIFLLGHTQLRYRPISTSVPEALPLRERKHALRNLFLVICAPLLCLGMFALDGLLDSYEAFGPLKVLNAVLLPFVAILIWAAIWALVGRLLVQRLHFPSHLVVISLGLLFATLFEAFSHIMAFAFSLDSLLPWLEAIGICATFVLILYGHLRLASRLRRKPALVAAMIFGTLLAGALQIKQLVYQQQFSTRPHFMLTLAPPAWRVISADTTAAFYNAAPVKLTEALNDDSAITVSSTSPETK